MTDELTNFRSKYPQYSDIDDNKLANMLAEKFPDSYGDLPSKYEQTSPSPEQVQTETPEGLPTSFDSTGYTQSQIDAAEELVKRGKLTRSEDPMSVAKFDPSGGGMGLDPNLKPLVKKGIHYLRPTIEGVASVAGAGAGMLTGPAAPAAVPVGGALGYAGAKQALDRLEEWATLPPEVQKLPAMQQMKNTMEDFRTGLTFEFGGPAAMKVMSFAGKGIAGGFKKVKDVIRKNTPALSEEQISKRAAEIIQEHRGNLDQYDKNLAESVQVGEDIPGFKSTIGEKTGDPGLIKLQRGLEAKPGVAAELSEVQKAENVEAIEGFLRESFNGGQTVDDVIKELTAQKAGLRTATGEAEQIAKVAEEAIPTATPQETGKRITKTIKEVKEPIKKIEKEYWDKVPNYEMTPTETERVFNELAGEPSTAQDIVKKHYELYKKRPKTIKGLQTTERELNDVIFDPNANATEKRVLGKIKTAINDDFKALGEAAEQGDFAVSPKGKVIHPKQVQRRIEEIDVKLQKEGIEAGGMSDAKPDIDKIYSELQENKVPGIMQQVAEEPENYTKRIVKDYKRTFKKDPPMLEAKEKPMVTHLKSNKVALEEQLKGAEPAKNAAIAYANAKAFSKSQVQDRFRSGVMKELEAQGTMQGGKKLPAEARPKKLMDVESADKFIKAVGEENAGDIMLRHYADDMATKVKVGKDGRFESASLSRWMKRNKNVLDRYGIDKEFSTADKAHKAMQQARIAEDDFAKSIAAKMLNSDPQNAVSRAFEGGEGVSGKNTGAIMRNLMKRVSGNKDARKGLENGFKDFMFQQAKTTAETLKGDSKLSKANLTKAMRRFAPAQAVLYKGQPDKIKALQTVQKALLIMNRTAKGVGGGPDTAEKMNAVMSVIGSVAHMPGVSYATKLAKVGLGMVKNLNKEETSDFMAKLLYDPDLAKIINRASLKNPPVKKIERELENYMERATMQAGRTLSEEKENK